MALQVGFARRDITPTVPCHKIGWLRDVVAHRVADPLQVRAAWFDDGVTRVALVTLDTLSVRWTTTEAIRARLAERRGLAPECVLVAATHNHAGPAVANCGAVARDDAYLVHLVAQAVGAVEDAESVAETAEVGFASGFEWHVAYNRRVLQRDGRVLTHGTFASPAALALEGPVDPEVAVIAARGWDGRLLGVLLNFACHPTHLGPDPLLSAGFPGAFERELRAAGCPVALYLQGAAGNLHFANPAAGGQGLDMEPLGRALADRARGLFDQLDWHDELSLAGRRATLELPSRDPSPAEVAGLAFGAQRFVDPDLYDEAMPALLERLRTRGPQPAEVQVLELGPWSLVTVPAECFTELGLLVKAGAWPRRALVVSCANGMVGYLPHAAAFAHGGYETTFAPSSRLAPGAGEQWVDAALELLRARPAGRG